MILLIDDSHEITQEMREVHLTEEKVSNFVDVMSDTMFIYPIDEAVKLRARHKDTMHTYFYMLTFPGFHTLANHANDDSYRRPTWEALKASRLGTSTRFFGSPGIGNGVCHVPGKRERERESRSVHF